MRASPPGWHSPPSWVSDWCEFQGGLLAISAVVSSVLVIYLSYSSVWKGPRPPEAEAP